MPATVAVEPQPVRDRSCAARHVLSPELFREVLARERNRAIRFDQPLLLWVISADRTSLDSSSTSESVRWNTWVWPRVIDALTEAARDTAVIGWLERHTVVGAILPAIGAPDPETLLRRELGRRLDAGTAGRFVIKSHVYCPALPSSADSFVAQAISPAPRRVARDALKRGLDVVGSLTLLLLLWPVLCLIAGLLKLTSAGPVLFRQTRIGQSAKPFTMLKFRTMRVDADPSLHHEFVTRFMRSSAQLHPAGRKAVFKLTNDPRVTPLGRILRKTSLDELPQLWNVLKGDMSLVGPRPPLAYEVEQYRPWHWRRVLDAKPGITGLWQVMGRSRTTFDEMVRLDLRYARTCSLWNDVKILLATPRAVISGKGAG
jgi:lipopolysaccharide/colanic/teichoic acid biosynthesis glycosyltransferase